VKRKSEGMKTSSFLLKQREAIKELIDKKKKGVH